jgi:hypothetical protein
MWSDIELRGVVRCCTQGCGSATPEREVVLGPQPAMSGARCPDTIRVAPPDNKML